MLRLGALSVARCQEGMDDIILLKDENEKVIGGFNSNHLIYFEVHGDMLLANFDNGNGARFDKVATLEFFEKDEIIDISEEDSAMDQGG